MPLIMSGISSVLVLQYFDKLRGLDTGTSLIFWIAISLAMGISLIPTSFVALITGYIWGLPIVFPLIISYALATIIGHFLSKYIDKNFILEEINKNAKAKNLIGKLQKQQFKIVALARLSPVFPFGISNVIFTYLGVALPKLVLAGIIGMLPRTLFMVWISTKADTLQSLYESDWKEYLKSPLFFIGILSILGLLFVVYRALKADKN
jgi:uncharacterized membrane protein YdjX (TVP38/TMEM64 family)